MRVAPIRLPRRLVLGLSALPVLASWLPRSRGLAQAGLVETATVVAALDPFKTSGHLQHCMILLKFGSHPLNRPITP
ncbi:hypothetical protein PhaeoP23_01714 [Phaeobacter piscinae]|uniref:Secreted protein n=1 Tax=Phaeobacter piscinae TaxID=1580596 RepID=A0ABM6PDP2_9RHOB|nr:hypothetical protein PhaeoP36_01714 [Phaeobacter piscinae]AUQ86377.1 hypothetical protein PhaeoP42_01715 [Phaeobacter piscinae]AUR24260.1 hypothetical protein PhaeoP23_01714 [Phaeobacter piscinae]